MEGHWAECHLRNPGVESQNQNNCRFHYRILTSSFWILLLAAFTLIRNRFVF